MLKIVDAVEEALVFNVVRLCDSILEGVCCEAQLGGAVALVGGDPVAALVLDPLGVEL